ncbi:uncharacterized protein LOC106872038 [Octopus bimaculoides]|uniref:BEN domain-containing protein n=1 Tax=Octopus bimaculoides TaxID=37653 RepID=A0A0L8H959_OCTBM|nr:uncharacterized protein LOC106872038 [Octopus bimaculoides]XP_052831285.1 uncharacterized protein LOC106872038 [Octopus bimaculoides]|eukprot:XP_014774361.1 PREDICTED: uncharacterized protein LOC106872038 [Octopus bimaculoides]
MSEPPVMYIKTEDDDDDDNKENLKKKIKYLEEENETLKKALEQLQQLQGKCCDWCELLMPNSDQERTVVSNWLESVLIAIKSQRENSEIVVEDTTSRYVPSLPAAPPPVAAPSPPPLPLPLSPSNPGMNLQPLLVEGTAMTKSLPINYMKLKAILRATNERLGDKMKYLLNKLVDAMFTRDELVAASGLGLRTQKDKQHTPLDRKKLTAIKEFLAEFSERKNIKMMDSRTFRVTVGNKITNARRNLRNEFKIDQIAANISS